MVRRKKLISRDLELEILRDYIEESYPSIKSKRKGTMQKSSKNLKQLKKRNFMAESFE